MMYFGYTPSRRVIAAGAAGSVLVAGLITYSGMTATAETPQACWIASTAEVLDPSAPPGAATPQQALASRKLEVSQTLTQLTSLSAEALRSTSVVPGGLPLLKSESAALSSAKLDSQVSGSAVFVAKDAVGAVSATFTASQSYKDGTWYISGQQVKLPAGTDCSKDQLGDR